MGNKEAPSNTFKPDALAGVDFNNVASKEDGYSKDHVVEIMIFLVTGVVIIDNQPDVFDVLHLEGFQEVVSRKEKRLRKELQQANDVPVSERKFTLYLLPVKNE